MAETYAYNEEGFMVGKISQQSDGTYRVTVMPLAGVSTTPMHSRKVYDTIASAKKVLRDLGAKEWD
jgi:hypothetical protein